MMDKPTCFLTVWRDMLIKPVIDLKQVSRSIDAVSFITLNANLLPSVKRYGAVKAPQTASMPPLRVSVGVGLLLIWLAIISIWVLRPNKITWYHSKTPAVVRCRSGKHRSLLEICKTLTSRCRLTPLLPDGHSQTAWGCLERRSYPLYYMRHLFAQQNPKVSGVFAVDFVTGADELGRQEIAPSTRYCTEDDLQRLPSADSDPMVIVLHGLCGGSHELYLQHLLAPLLSGKGNWHACVLISRGCAGTPIKENGIYNALLTDDLRQIVNWLRKAFPNSLLFAVGFSMGSIILTRYVAVEKRSCVFKGVVTISNPWNLEVCALHLQRLFLGRLVYSPFMAPNLMRIFWQNALTISSHTPIDLRQAKQVRYIHEFDRFIQCPTWGFRTETEYYRQACSSSSVLDVAVPFLAINATDDPITGSEVLPIREFQQNEWTVLCVTNKGGHLGWFEFNGRRWYVPVVYNFLQEMHGGYIGQS